MRHDKRTAIIVLVLGLALPLIVAAQTRSMQVSDGSAIRFIAQGENLMRPARGRFSAISGRLEFDPANLAATRGHVGVLLTSIHTADSGWDEMFRRAGFLDLDEHPRAQFELTGIRGATELSQGVWTSVTLVGRFTLHGNTHEVEVPSRVKWSRQGRQDRLALLGDFHIQWADYEISIPPTGVQDFGGEGAEISLEIQWRPR